MTKLFSKNFFATKGALLGFILVLVVFTFFQSRWIFFNQLKPAYLKDYYQHSQWNIPQSTRVMSDNELYQYSAYQLAQGSNPIAINPEVPPAGKYFYAWSIALFNNPYLTSVLLYLVSLTSFFLFLKSINPTNQALLGTALLAATPLFASQISRTMLDLPQFCFFLIHLLLISHLVKKSGKWLIKKRLVLVKNLSLSLLAGISLGLMASTKLPLFLPLILLFDGWLLCNKKKLKLFALILICSGLTYLGTYGVYFFQGHSLLDWLRLQKWIFNFYRHSTQKNNKTMFFITTFTGFYKGWWQDPWSRVATWSLIWPSSFIISLSYLYQQRTKLSLSRLKCFEPSLSLLFISFSLTFILIPFWPRYFFILLPFTIYFLLKALAQKPYYLIALGLISTLELFAFFWQPIAKPWKFIQTNWENQHYQELYQNFTLSSQKQTNQIAFAQKMAQLDQQKQVLNRKIELVKRHNAGVKSNLTLKITEKLPIGNFTYQCQLEAVQKLGQWKLNWNWQCLAPNFKQNDKFLLDLEPAPQGTLYKQQPKQKQAISRPGPRPFILIDKKKLQPHLLDRNQLFHQIFALTNVRTVDQRNLLEVTHRWSQTVAIGFVKLGYDPKLLSQVAQSPAVIVEKKLDREYLVALSKLNEKELRTLIQWEKQHPTLFGQAGGKLWLIATTSTQSKAANQPAAPSQKLLLETKPIEGKDVVVEKIPNFI